MPLPFIFIILDFKDFYQFSLEEFSEGRFSYWAMFTVGNFMAEKVIFWGGIFHEEFSLNRSNGSTAVQIFQRSQNKFNVVSTNYST